MNVKAYRDLIIDQMPFGVIVLDNITSLTIVDGNEFASSSLVGNNNTLMGKSLLDFIVAPKDVEIFKMDPQIDLSEVGGRLVDCNTWLTSNVVLKFATGELYACSLQLRLLTQDVNGNVLALFYSVDDAPLSVFMQSAEKEIGEAYSKLAERGMLLDRARDAIISTNLAGVIIYWNRGAEKLYGWSKSEALGKQYLTLVTADSSCGNNAHNVDFSANEVFEWSGEQEHVSKSGDILIVESSWSSVSTSADKPVSFSPGSILIINSNITERKRIERQFLESRHLESLGVLAGGIAHDFNNILGIIMGHAALLERDCSRCSYSHHIEPVINAANKGALLVKQLLTFSRKNRTKTEVMQVNDLIVDVVNLIKATLPCSISISTKLESSLPCIAIEETQINQVILNLCVNARDAIRNQGTIEILTSVVSGAVVEKQFGSMSCKNYVKIAISDTGEGIDLSLRNRIFEPFFTTKHSRGGSGLGLSIVFGIVKNCDGFIECQSEPGIGTTFSIYFPVCSAELPPNKEDSNVKIKALAATAIETVLLMEDEPLLMELIQSILTDAGYSVISAYNGVDGVKLFEDNRNIVNLVLADINLPEMNGLDALLRINEVRRVKSIVITGHVDCREYEDMDIVDAVIQKPNDIPDILDKVREVLCEKHAMSMARN